MLYSLFNADTGEIIAQSMTLEILYSIAFHLKSITEDLNIWII